MATAAVALVELRPVGQESVQGAFARISKAAGDLGRQGSTALRTVAQSAASVADAGKLSAGSLATMLGQLGDLAVGFGAAGPLVGAIAVAGGAITKMFLNSREEIKKTRETFETEIANMLNAADYEALAKKARDIEFGTAAKPGGLDALKAQRAALQQWINDHPLAIFKIGETQHEIDQLTEKIRPLQAEWDAVTKALNTPQLIAHQSGLAQGITITAESAEDAAKRVMTAESDQVTALADLAKQGRLTAQDIQAAAALEARLAAATDRGTAAVRAQTGALLDRLRASGAVLGAGGPRVNNLPLPDIEAQEGAALAAQSKKINSRIHVTVGGVIDQAKVQALLLKETLQQQFADGVAGGLVQGIGQGFAAAFRAGSIGEGFKQLGAALLSGLGGAMIQFGEASLLASTLMLKLKTALMSFNPIVGIGVSLALIATGALLQSVAGAAQSSFGGIGGGSSVGAIAAPVARPDDILRVTLGPTSATTAAGMQPVQPIHFTVIGANDPIAQRQIVKMVTNAQRRGIK